MKSATSQVGNHPAAGLTLPERSPQAFRKAAPRESGVPGEARSAVFELDEAHRIIYCNSAAARLYGFRAAEVVGIPFGQATDCDWPPALNEPAESWENYNGWAGLV